MMKFQESKLSLKRSRPGAVSHGASVPEARRGAVFVGFEVAQASLALHYAIVDSSPVVVEAEQRRQVEQECSPEGASDAARNRTECLCAGVQFVSVPTFADVQYCMQAGALAVLAAGRHLVTDMVVAANYALSPETLRRAEASGMRVLAGPAITIVSVANTWLVPEQLVARLITQDTLLHRRTFNQSCIAPWSPAPTAASGSRANSIYNDSDARTGSDCGSVASGASARSRRSWSWGRLLRAGTGAIISP